MYIIHITIMIIFHPEVHLPHFEAQKEILKTRAMQNEIRLFLECKNYDIHSESNLNGFETLEGLYPETILCTTYTMSQVPFVILKEGGNHSIAVLVFFLYCVSVFPDMKEFMFMHFKNEPWFPSYIHFVEEIAFDIHGYEQISENMKQHIRNRAKLYGGLPSNIPFESIRKCTMYMINHLFPNQDIDNVIIQKTLIQREKYMAENLIHVVKNHHSKQIPIHVCIGAGHLMPFLNEKHISQLGLDLFFMDYHAKITHTRLLHHLQKEEIAYEIEC